MLNELREHLKLLSPIERDRLEALDAGTLTLLEVARLTHELLDEPTNVQALALARLMRDRPHSGGCSINTEAFDLPNGYWLVTFMLSGFTCGIAPDGSVSS